MLRRATVLGLVVAAVLVVQAGVAWADGAGGVTVGCQNASPTPGCTVSAETPGQPSNPTPAPAVHPQAGVAGGAGGVCHDWRGKVAPCSEPTFGWMGSNGCYWKVDPTWRPPAWDTADQPPAGQTGAFYSFTCLGNFPGTGGGMAWLPAAAGPGGPPPPPPPAVLAAQATNRVVLPSGGIGASPSPGADQLVNLPTWVWLAGSSWRAVSATAAVPGESVTATARPTSVTWTFGDGATMICHGPGTPYAASDNPAAASPTCGHTYTASSAGQPDGAYPVSATVTWSVTWTGGGQTGVEPALRTTARAAFAVAESQAINTSPGRAS